MNKLEKYFLIVLFPALTAGCSQKPAPSPADQAVTGEAQGLKLSTEQISANNLVLGQPDSARFTRKVNATGYLEAAPENKRIVTARVGGTIRNLRLLPGDKVAAGQPLFTLENPEFIGLQEEFLSASESLLYLKEEFERQKALAGENAAARKTLKKAETEYLSTLARVSALKSRLTLVFIDPAKLTPENIRAQVVVPAPISGYITMKKGENGQTVSNETEILEIVQPDPLLLHLAVFEKDILQVQEKQEVNFTVPDASDMVFTATIVKTGKALTENRTVEVTAQFDSRKSPLRLIPGMFVRAEIITGGFKALSLPVTAVVESDNQHFILVKTNPENDFWVLEKVKVEIGAQDEEKVEILAGSQLKPGQSVVIKGAFGIINL